ncbi:ATP-binding protein [Cytobacillus sp. Hm23]
MANLTKSKWILIVSGIMTIAIVVMYYSSPFIDKSSPLSEDGVLNLSLWDFEKDGLVRLNGEWELYPNQLLLHEDINNTLEFTSTPQYVQVPENWINYDLNNYSIGPYGKATFRLIINIDGGDHIFGIKTASIRMSNRIFINGKEIGFSGDPNRKSEYTPANTPYVKYFTLENGLNEVIVHVANYDFLSSGGIVNSIYFGYQEDISSLRDKALMHDWVQSSLFIVVGLFFIGLYSQRKNDSFLLFFSIHCLFAGLFVAVHGEKIWYLLFPNTPYNIILRIQLISLPIASIFLYLFLYSALREVVSKRIVYVMCTFGALVTVYVILFPNYISIIFHISLTIFYIYTQLYATYVMLKAALLSKEGAIYMVFAALAMIVYVVKYLMSFYSIGSENSWLFKFPVDPFVFLLMFSLLISLQFSNAFKKNEQLSKELIKMDKVKDEFLARTSHELKTPLHGIMNISSFLLDTKEPNLSTKQRENLSLIHDTAIKLSTLVNDLVDVTRLKNGELHLIINKLDLQVTTQMVFNVLNFEIQGKQLQLVNNIHKSTFVHADENRLRQVLYNLIHNAIKHTEKGKIIVSAKLVDQTIFVYVEDTGVGIPKAKYEEIFGYFEQLDKLSLQDGYQSMGLGLYICKQLIEKMSGDIWVDWSEIGIGTRMAFTLPVAPCTEKEKVENSIQQSSIPSNSILFSQGDFDSVKEHENTILIVDDERSNIQILFNLLTKHNFNVISAFSARDALRKIEKYKTIDLAIIDVMMPVMSGIELCNKIRRTYSLLELPILFATVKDLPEDIELGFKAGANDYITKPFDGNTILARIQTLISMKKSMEEAFNNELAFLQAQIKPHFLYNAISNIISFCYTDGQKAAHLLTMLSQYLRIIYSSDHKTMFVPLQQELDLINAYVEIEKARFERFEFICEIDRELDSFYIPSLCIQPFVENAIRHGLFAKEGQGYVSLTIKENGKYILVQIVDDGVGMTNEVLQQFHAGKIKSAGIGMTNIKKRLETVNESNLEVYSKKHEGTRINFQLPKYLSDGFRADEVFRKEGDDNA